MGAIALSLLRLAFDAILNKFSHPSGSLYCLRWQVNGFDLSSVGDSDVKLFVSTSGNTRFTSLFSLQTVSALTFHVIITRFERFNGHFSIGRVIWLVKSVYRR